MHNLLKIQLFVSFIKKFFNEQDFLEVMTPPMVENPGMETHIHPMSVSSTIGKHRYGYLHTSPEFELKHFLAYVDEIQNIFNISFCYRDEPLSPIHRPQFLMLEWYRKNQFYSQIKNDLKNLIEFCLIQLEKKQIKTIFKTSEFKIETMTVDECFKKFLGYSILDFLDAVDLRKKIELDHPDVPLPKSELSWEDYFFLLFLNKIEPELAKIPMVIIDQYPYHLAALSTINQENPLVCDRFELYIHGIEIANCYNELIDEQEQKRRFIKQAQDKQTLYQYQLAEPSKFYKALEHGLPKSCGIALGIERLLQALTGEENLFYLDA